MRLVGFIGEGRFASGSCGSAPPLCRLFGYFLAETRKYRRRQAYNLPSYIRSKTFAQIATFLPAFLIRLPLRAATFPPGEG